VGWAALSELVPYYPLYALLFLDTGLSGAQISALFAVWSVTGFVCEVPAGALADRWSRRGAVVLASMLQAAAFAVWTAAPAVWAFALGFVIWGVGGALVSGASEALVYDGLAAVGAADDYVRVNGWMTSAELLVQLPTAFAASALFALGGYPLVGWASVAVCLAAAALALRFPEAPRNADDDGEEALAGDWGVPTAAVPVAVLVIALAGAAGAALGGRADRLRGGTLLALLVVAAGLLAVAALWARPAALGAVAVFYALYLAVLVVAEARLQDGIASTHRATITSVAGLGIEVASLLVFAAWALGGAVAVAVLVIAVVPVVRAGLRTREPGAPAAGTSRE
jgi:MFS family permease